MHDCGQCGSCGGCMELTAQEVELLQVLGQIPFLPVARKPGEETPVCLEPELTGESWVLQCLEKRGLISIDYDKPLKAYGPAYDAYSIRGSFALTARGQQVVELMEYQGIG